ncbi:unnamed protein product [Toxocara canis]|uniref:Uncharacterized protein n=1 Tax=Toxocara canis TaxID=6265 RepID=A0A183UYA5_TOXCA|nr:unnamed protein product [Toxocara canis]
MSCQHFLAILHFEFRNIFGDKSWNRALPRGALITYLPRGAKDNASVFATEDCRLSNPGTAHFSRRHRPPNGCVAQWITRRSTEPKITGSSPAVVEDIGHWALTLISPMIHDVMPAFSRNFAILISEILASQILNDALLKSL